MDKTIYWILILGLFATNLWGVQNRPTETGQPFTVYSSNQQILIVKEEYTPKLEDFIGYCNSESMNSGASVYLTDSLEKNTGGKFWGEKNQLAISKNYPEDYIKNVAHEVSHLIDDITAQQGITGTEATAYLQGYYTECVYDLVMKNTKKKDEYGYLTPISVGGGRIEIRNINDVYKDIEIRVE